MKINHYNQKYFDWQKSQGDFGGKADLFKFQKYIKSSDKVIDFGCGGGYLLKAIKCRDRLGIEINSSARKSAKENGIKAVPDASKISNQWADVIISNHALEHVQDPLGTLIKLKSKLKKNGKIVFVVPFERGGRFSLNDINMHLYTWAPQNLGNLFKISGYKIKSVEIINHFWPPYYWLINKFFGFKVFNLTARIYGLLNLKTTQVRIVATNSV